MYQYTIEFTGHPITLKTEKKIKKSFRNLISKHIEGLKNELSHTIKLSSAHRFNEAKNNTVTILSKNFIDYLLLNIELSRKTRNQFKPFTEDLNFESSDELIEYDLENSAVIKKVDLTLSDTLLFSPFILEKLEVILNENSIDDYLISKNNFFSSKSKDFNDIEFDVEDNFTYKDRIKNEKLLIQFNSNHKKKIEGRSKFGMIDAKIKPKFFLIFEDSFVDCVLFYTLLRNMTMESEFKTFAYNNNLEFKVIDKKNKVHLFTPHDYS